MYCYIYIEIKTNSGCEAKQLLMPTLLFYDSRTHLFLIAPRWSPFPLNCIKFWTYEHTHTYTFETAFVFDFYLFYYLMLVCLL